jgi:hypothetical protein
MIEDIAARLGLDIQRLIRKHPDAENGKRQF